MVSQSLTQLLLQQKQQLDALADKLESELHYISVRNADALMQLMEEKTTLLDAIAHIDTQVEEAFAEGAVPDDEQQELIRAISSQLDACKFRTDINQKAVEQGQLRLSHLQHLLNELRAKESLTYDRKGRTNGGRSAHDISV